MTHQEIVRNAMRELLERIDVLYKLFGHNNGSGVFIDTVFMQEMYHRTEFLRDVTELNKHD